MDLTLPFWVLLCVFKSSIRMKIISCIPRQFIVNSTDEHVVALRQEFKDKYDAKTLSTYIGLWRWKNNVGDAWPTVGQLNYIIRNDKKVFSKLIAPKVSVSDVSAARRRLAQAFPSSRQRDLRVNMIARSFANFVYKQLNKAEDASARLKLSPKDISKVIDDFGGVRGIMLRIQRDYKKNGDEETLYNYALAAYSSRMPADQAEKQAREKAKYIADEYKKIDENFAQLADLACNILHKTVGITTNYHGLVLDNTAEFLQEQEDIKDENGKETRYGKDYREEDTISTLAPKVQYIINNIPMMDRDGNEVLDDIGHTVYLNPLTVNCKLLELYACRKPEEMLTRIDPKTGEEIPGVLNTAAEKYTWLKSIIEYLNSHPQDKTALFNNYSKTVSRYTMLHSIKGKRGTESQRVSAIQLSKASAVAYVRTLKDTILSGITLNDGAIYDENTVVIKDGRLDKYRDELDQIQKNIESKFQKRFGGAAMKSYRPSQKELSQKYQQLTADEKAEFDNMLDRVAYILQAIGYDVDKQDLIDIATAKPGKTKKDREAAKLNAIHHITDSAKALLKSFKACKRTEDFFNKSNGVTSMYTELGSYLKLSTTDTIEPAVLLRGKRLQTYTLGNLLHTIADELANTTGMSEEEYIDMLQNNYVTDGEGHLIEGMTLDGKPIGWLKELLERAGYAGDYPYMRVFDIVDYDYTPYKKWTKAQHFDVAYSMFTNPDSNGGSAYEVQLQADYDISQFISFKRYGKGTHFHDTRRESNVKTFAPNAIPDDPNTVFVYKTSKAGTKANDIKNTAVTRFEANPDVISGPSGRGYALPIASYKNEKGETKKASRKEVRDAFNALMLQAIDHPEKNFYLAFGNEEDKSEGGWSDSQYADVLMSVYDMLTQSAGLSAFPSNIIVAQSWYDRIAETRPDKTFRDINEDYELVDEFTDEVLAEIDRMKAISARKKMEGVPKLTVYEEKGMRFWLFPKMNDNEFLKECLVNKDETLRNIVRKRVVKEMHDYCVSKYNELKKSTLKKTNTELRVDKDGKLSYTKQDMLEDFLLNSLYARYEMSKLLSGGAAFFGDKATYEKRMMFLHSPTRKLDTMAEYNGERVMTDNQRSLYVKDKKFVSAYKEDLEEMLQVLVDEKRITPRQKEDMLATYGSIKETDGQAFRSLESYRKLCVGGARGDIAWSEREERAYQNIIDGNFSANDIDVFLHVQPLKLFDGGFETVTMPDGRALRSPYIHKCLDVVNLAPYLAKAQGSYSKLPQAFSAKLRAIGDVMSQENLDVVYFTSDVKVGAWNESAPLEDFVDTEGNNTYDAMLAGLTAAAKNGTHVTPFKYLGVSASTREHFADSTRSYSSQAIKMVLSGTSEDAEIVLPGGKKIGGKDNKSAKRTFYELYSAIITKQYKQLLELFGNDRRKLEKELQTELALKPYNSPELRYALTLTESGEFVIPLYSPLVTTAVQNLLTSIIRKRITRPQVPGGSMLQVSSYGLDQVTVKSDESMPKEKRLKIQFAGKGKDKHIKYIECYAGVYNKDLLKFANKDGIIDDEGIQLIEKKYPSLLRMIGYRTPSDNVHSVIPLKIVGFLPELYGGQIMVPREVMVMTGNDFDGDKLLVHYHDFTVTDFDKGKFDALYEKYKDLFNKENRTVKENNLLSYLLPDYAITEEFPSKDEFRDIVESNPEFAKMVHLEEPEVNTKDYNWNSGPLHQDDGACSNGLLDIMWGVLTSPEGSRRMVLPGGCPDVERMSGLVRIMTSNDEELVNKFMKNHDLSNRSDMYKFLSNASPDELKAYLAEFESEESLFSITTQLDSAYSIMQGEQMIGMYALANAGLAQLMGYGIKLNPEHLKTKSKDSNERIYPYLFGTKIDEIARYTSEEGQYVGDAIAQLINAAVDNPKNPILGWLNQNSITVDVMTLLSGAGLSLEQSLLFINQPVIRLVVDIAENSPGGIHQALKDVSKIMYDRSPAGDKNADENSSFVDNMTQAGWTKYGIRQAFSTLEKIDEDEMACMLNYDIENADYNKDWFRKQRAVLATFGFLLKPAQDLKQLISVIRPEAAVASTGPTLGATLSNLYEIYKVTAKNTRTINPDNSVGEKKSYIDGVENVLQAASFNDDDSLEAIYKEVISSGKPIVSAMHSMALQGTFKMLQSLFPQATPNWVQTIFEIVKLYNYRDEQRIPTETFDGIIAHMITYKVLKHPKLMNMSDKDRRYYMVDLPKKVQDIKQQIFGVPKSGETKPDWAKKLQNNQFLKKLLVDPPKSQHDLPWVRMEIEGSMNQYLAEDMRTAWNDLLDSENAEVRQLARDLYMYCFMTSGATFGKFSFANFATTEVIRACSEYSTALQSILNSEWDQKDLQEFKQQYVQNNWEFKMLVPIIPAKHFESEYDEATPDGKIQIRVRESDYYNATDSEGRAVYLPQTNSGYYSLRAVKGKHGNILYKVESIVPDAEGSKPEDAVKTDTTITLTPIPIIGLSQKLTQYFPGQDYGEPIEVGQDSVWGHFEEEETEEDSDADEEPDAREPDEELPMDPHSPTYRVGTNPELSSNPEVNELIKWFQMQVFSDKKVHAFDDFEDAIAFQRNINHKYSNEVIDEAVARLHGTWNPNVSAGQQEAAQQVEGTGLASMDETSRNKLLSIAIVQAKGSEMSKTEFVSTYSKRYSVEALEEAYDLAVSDNQKPEEKHYRFVTHEIDENGNDVIVTRQAKKTPRTTDLARKQETYHRLAKVLTDILKQHGVSVGVLRDTELRLQASGVTDFSQMSVITEGMVELIRLANGIEGEKALPEEFAHTALAMLGYDHPLVKRLLDAIDDDMAKRIIGDEYDKYVAEYSRQAKGDAAKTRRLLRIEAAGKLVNDKLILHQEREDTKRYGNLIQRVVAAIKDFFRKFNLRMFRYRTSIAEGMANSIASGFLNGALADEMNIANIRDNAKYLQLKAKIKQDESVIQKLLNIEAKRLSVYTRRMRYMTNQQKKDVKEINHVANVIAQLENDIIHMNLEGGVATYCTQSMQFIEDCEKKLDSQVAGASNLNALCRTLVTMRDTYFSFKEAIDDISDAMEAEPDVFKNLSRDAYRKLSSELNNFYAKYRRIAIKAYVDMVKHYIGQDVKIGIGKNKGETLNIDEEAMLAQRDISTVDRWIDSMADSGDIVLQAFDVAIKEQKNAARYEALQDISEITAADAALKRAGFTDYKWMFAVKNGKRTGEYITEKEAQGLSAAQYAFYTKMMELKRKYLGMLPPNITKELTTIKIRKDLLERVSQSGSVKNGTKQIWEALEDSLFERSDDVDFDTHEIYIDFEGNRFDTLPLYFLHRKEGESEEDVSQDVPSTMAAFAYMAHVYHGMSDIIYTLENARQISQNERQVAQRRGSKLMQETTDTASHKDTRTLTKLQKDTKIGGKLDTFMEMQAYGRLKKDEGTIGNSRANVRKVVDAMNAVASFSQLALNLPQRFANVLTGAVQIFEEINAKEFYDAKDAAWAKAKFAQYAPGAALNTAKIDTDNKLQMFMDYFNVTQDFDKRIRDKGYRKKRIGRLASFEYTLYGLMTAGEYYLAATTGLAMAHRYRMRPPGWKEGDKTVSLFDAMEVKYRDEVNKAGAYIQVKPGYTKEDGTEFTTKDAGIFTNKIAGVNFRLNGIYNMQDRSALQQTAIGALTIMYRKWMRPSLSRRYRKAKLNTMTGEWEEGFYVTTFNFLKDVAKDWRHFSTAWKVSWAGLDEVEKSNCRRSCTELSILLLLTFARGIFNGLPDDDDKEQQDVWDWGLSMVTLQTYRLIAEIGGIAPTPMLPDQLLKIVKSPFAAMDVVEHSFALFSILDPNNYKAINPNAEIKAGRYKGKSKAYRALMNAPLVSIARTISRGFHPGDSIIYYKQ